MLPRQGTAIASARPALVLCAGAAMCAVLTISLTGCGADHPGAPTPTLTRLELQYRSPSGWHAVGSSLSYAAYVMDSDGAFDDVTARVLWASTDPSVLRMTSPGSFQAVSPGTADVLATFDGLTASLSVSVRAAPPPYPYMRISPAFIRQLGEGAQARAFVEQGIGAWAEVTATATWVSSNPTVATVRQGYVTAAGIGTTEISASRDGLTAWYRFSVPPPSSPVP